MTSWLTGGILIIVGFLVKAFPNLIAGYNTMSEKQKANVDIKGLSSLIRNGMIVIGMIVIGSDYLFRWIGLGEKEYTLIPATLIIVSAIIMVIFAQRYDHN